MFLVQVNFIYLKVNFIYHHNFLISMPKKKIASLKKEETSAISHKPFWAVIISIFIISIITILNYIEAPILTGNVVVQPISFLKEGSELHVEVKDVKGVDEVTITVLDEVKNGLIRIEKMEPADFTGTAYSSFVISSTDEEKFGQIKFKLKILDDDLLKTGISPFDVVLYHEGEELPTLRSTTKGGYAYYTTASQGLGNFVIGRSQVKFAEKVLEEEPVIEEELLPERPKEEIAKVIPEEVKKSFWEKFVDFLKGLFSF